MRWRDTLQSHHAAIGYAAREARNCCARVVYQNSIAKKDIQEQTIELNQQSTLNDIDANTLTRHFSLTSRRAPVICVGMQLAVRECTAVQCELAASIALSDVNNIMKQ